jgi:hypothetical protein
MKLEYTKKELKQQGWATIGGRIEDFSLIGWLKGKKTVYKEIKRQYGENTDDVYRGFLVYTEFGADTYYNIKNL